jgi:hypothetical protein
MKIVKQRHHGDCAICSLAMFLSVSYETIESLVSKFEAYEGLTEEKTLEIANMFEEVELKLDESWDRSRPAIVMLPSLNLLDIEHACYWDGKKIWDPSTKVPYLDLPSNIIYALQKTE